MKYQERNELVTGLRAMADWIERNGLELHSSKYCDPKVELNFYHWNKDDVVQSAKIFGKCEKKYTDYAFELVKPFSSNVTMTAWAGRETVCTKKQVGTKFVPKVERVETGEMVEEPVFEWECEPSLLAS